MDPLTAGITAGGSIIGGIANTIGQGKLSRKMWKMQAEYNSPIQQMQRLKAAGLNPHLVYGQGAQGASGSMSNAPDTPRVDFGIQDFASNYATLQQLKMTETKQAAEIESMRIANDMTIAKTESEILGNKFNYESFQDRLASIKLQNDNIVANTDLTKTTKENKILERPNIQATLEKIKADTKVSEGQLKIQAASLSKTAQEIKNLVEQRKYVEAQKELQQELLRWYKMGVSPNSSPLHKLLYEILAETGIRDGVIKLIKDVVPDGKPKTKVGKVLNQIGSQINNSTKIMR